MTGTPQMSPQRPAGRRPAVGTAIHCGPASRREPASPAGPAGPFAVAAAAHGREPLPQVSVTVSRAGWTECFQGASINFRWFGWCARAARRSHALSAGPLAGWLDGARWFCGHHPMVASYSVKGAPQLAG